MKLKGIELKGTYKVNFYDDFFESFYISNRVKVPLKGLLIIGY